MRDCPFRRVGNIAPIRPTLLTLPVRRNLDPLAEELLFHPSGMINAEKARTGADHGRGQVYNMTAEALGDAATKYEAQYPEQEP